MNKSEREFLEQWLRSLQDIREGLHKSARKPERVVDDTWEMLDDLERNMRDRLLDLIREEARTA